MRTFRAWDNKKGCWITEDITISHDGVIRILSPSEPTKLLDADDIKIEFYSGEKDKKGKEVCVGEILQVRSTYETDEPTNGWAKVYFRKGAFTTDFHGMLLRSFTQRGNWECWIIGNIHDNAGVNPETLMDGDVTPW